MSGDGPVSGRRQDEPPGPLTFPLRLRCRSAHELVSAAGLEDAVARALSRAFDRARRAVPAARTVGLQPPTLVKGELSPEELATLLSRLSHAIEQAATAESLPLAPATPAPARTAASGAPAAKADQAGTWRIRIKVLFRLTPRQFFEIRAKFAVPRDGGSLDPADPLELYFPLLDEPMPATAWVAEVLSEREFTALGGEVLRRFGATRKPNEYVWSIHGWGWLRGLVAEADRDHRVAAEVPDFSRRGFVDDRPGPAGGEQQTVLRPGAWTFSVFLPLPNLALGDLVELGPLATVDVPLSEAVRLNTPEAFAAAAGLDGPAAVRQVPDLPVKVVVTPFQVRRRTHERTLAALFDRYRRDLFCEAPLGTVVPFTDSAIQGLGPTLGPLLSALAGAGSARAGGPTTGFWPPGAGGANLTVRVENLRKQILRTANAGFLASEAGKVQQILGTENGFWSADRTDALRVFISRWANDHGPELFVLLLDELQQRGTLDAFVAAVRDLSATFLKRAVVALAAGDPRVASVAGDIGVIVQGLLRNHYDVPAQSVQLLGDKDKTVHAAGASGDDKAGVVAEVYPYYSESGRVLQPKPEVLDRLREPTRKKVSELIRRMACQPGERLTREELLQKATQQAAAEMPPLEEKDLVKVTLVKSVRVLRLESRLERGVEEIYVHFQPVQKVGDNPWMPAGDVRVGPPAEFEAHLTSYHIQHLERLLTVVMLAEAVVLGGVMIIELGVATLGQLFFFVSMQVVIYHFTTDAEDRTLEGYLGAALKGELDAVGFKIVSGAVTKLGGFAAGQLVTRQLVGQVATKWIVFGLRGVATATGVGGLELTFQLGEDLLHYSLCQGWSSPGQYWDRFKTGFLMTLAFEFLAVPILAPPIRLALEKASTAREAARALRSSGKSLREIAGLLLKGAEEVETAIARTVQHDAGVVVRKGFQEKVGAVLKALGREYESRAYRSLLELYGPELSGPGAEGLRRLLGVGGERQVDALLQRVLSRKGSPTDLLALLGKVDEPLIAELSKAGKLAALGGLDEPAITLLQQLHSAKVQVGALFDGSGPSLEKFADEFGKLTEAQRVAALENATGKSPAQILEEARAPAKPDTPAPAAPKPSSLAEVLSRLEAYGFSRADLRDFIGVWKQVTAPLARRVARLLEHYAPDEVRAFGKFLAKHKVPLTNRTVAHLIDVVPPGKLKAAIPEFDLMRAGEDPPSAVWTEEELTAREDVTVREGAPPKVRKDVQGLELPLRDVAETPGSRALRASLIARDGVLPPDGSHAHHIVPEKDFGTGLDWLRNRLANAGCGINEASNGVFLAGSRFTANPELTLLHLSYIHAGVRKEMAYTLTRLFEGKTGAELVEAVEKAGKLMAEGEFEILEIPHGWKAKWEPGMTAPADPKVKPEWIEE